MADLCCEYTYAGLTINDATEGVDRLVVDANGEITGLDGAPIRSQIDPRGRTDGGIVHTKLFAARIVVFKGYAEVQSVENRLTAEYREAMMALQSSVIAALEAQLNTESPLVWTPAGLTTHTLQASYGIVGGEIQFSGLMIDADFTFTLVASDPTIAVA